MSRLIDAMTGSLHGDLLFGRQVVSIDTAGTEALVTCADGQRYRAGHVICTVPLTVLRDIDIHPALPPRQREAVAGIPYGHGTSVFLPVRERFWEEDGLPPSIWGDGMLPRVMKWQSQMGEYLWVYLSGRANEFCRTAPDDEVVDRVMTELVRIRPSTAGRVEPGAIMCWSKRPWSRGTFAYRGPGDVQRHGDAIMQPHGRVHFAGEHTSVLSMGLEGAMESAERAAFELLERLG
jgi:monoamine oxidase